MPTIGRITATMLLVLVAMPSFAGQLTLEKCLQQASAANRSLKLAAIDEQVAADGKQIARSGYLPRIDFQGGYTSQKDPQAVKFGPKPTETQDANFGFYNISLTQTLYDFGKTGSRYRRATLLQESAGYDYSGREKETFLQVVQAYYGIMQANKILKAADEEMEQRREHLRIAGNLYEQGVVTRNDVLQAEVKLAESKQRRLAAANQIENTWLLLNFLIGQPLQSRGELEEQIALPQVGISDTMVQTALTKRPELTAIEKRVQAAEAEVGETRSGYYPEIYGKLAVDYVENSKVTEQAIMSATVGLRVNLFDGLATTSRLRQSVKSLSRTRENKRLLEDQIRVELQTAVNDLQLAAEQIKTVETAIKQGEENLRINKDRYQEQVGTATEVLDAQTLLTQIKTDYYNATFAYQVAVARVRKAMGEL